MTGSNLFLWDPLANWQYVYYIRSPVKPVCEMDELIQRFQRKHCFHIYMYINIYIYKYTLWNQINLDKKKNISGESYWWQVIVLYEIDEFFSISFLSLRREMAYQIRGELRVIVCTI